MKIQSKKKSGREKGKNEISIHFISNSSIIVKIRQPRLSLCLTSRKNVVVTFKKKLFLLGSENCSIEVKFLLMGGRKRKEGYLLFSILYQNNNVFFLDEF